MQFVVERDSSDSAMFTNIHHRPSIWAKVPSTARRPANRTRSSVHRVGNSSALDSSTVRFSSVSGTM
jgi:hypothetical protein